MVDTGRGIVTIRVTPHIQAKAGFGGIASTVLAVPVCSSLNKEGRKILVLLTRPIFLIYSDGKKGSGVTP